MRISDWSSDVCSSDLGRIGTWLAVQQDRAAAWKNKPIPGEQHAALARRDFAVIFADQPRALRDEKNASRRAVIDILRDLGGDLAGQVRLDAGDQRGRDAAARLHDLRDRKRVV